MYMLPYSCMLGSHQTSMLGHMWAIFCSLLGHLLMLGSHQMMQMCIRRSNLVVDACKMHP
jgi:hypothetical protein